ncbi:MAG: hypothetical protein IAE80_02910 [Anaerolinea sp.]|nr:hypothetical protein [Anaerolinea sp.]
MTNPLTRRAARRDPLLIRILVTAGGLLLCAWFVFDFARLAQIAFTGAPADGVYVRRWTGSNNSRHIEYRYTVDGVEYSASTWVWGDLYDRAPNMPALPVVYARTNPAFSVLDGVNIWEFLLKGAFSLLIVVASLDYLVERWRKLSSLLTSA